MPDRRTLQRALLLAAMLQAPNADWYGLELVRDSGLKSGTVYPALAGLERAGLLESHWESVDPRAAGRPRRRIYRLVGTRLGDADAYVRAFDAVLARSKGKHRRGAASSLRSRLA